MTRARLSRAHRRGQSLVEATFVLMVFFGLLLSVVDCGQVLFAQQSLTERVRGAVRWGILHPYQGPGEVTNLILYGQTSEPLKTTPGYLGMTPANVRVSLQTPTPEQPDDSILTVAIVNFESHFYSPWIGKALVSPRAVQISAPMAITSAN